ncbi:MAG: hypothetical protein M5U26_18490 [Planctomycetota bacterium]|nr:hypothetical protein [Planctomycetota bacterium]
MRRRAALPALALCALACAARAAEDGDEAFEYVLRNELPVSGPRVTLRQTYGRHYRAGAATVLDGYVHVAEPEFAGGIAVREGDGEHAPEYGLRARFRNDTPTRFRFPIRAPVEGAVLRLEVWREDPDGGQRRAVFRGRLLDALRVLGDRERLVWLCGTSRWVGRKGWHPVRLRGEQLPEQDWMYENVDLAVLGRGAFEGATEPAMAALRRWVLGGGRLLIVSPDALDALMGAVGAGLTPLPPDTRELPNSPDWWYAQARLRPSDVALDASSRLVFARYGLGWGGGVFFFPWATTEAMQSRWEDALNAALDSGEAAGRADRRIWRRPFEFFPQGAVAVQTRRSSVLWALVGAAMMAAALAYARAERARYMAAGLALGAIALLSAGLAKLFPAPELVVSRVTFREVSLDGRARREVEFAYLEGLREPERLRVGGPAGGTLNMLHETGAELPRSGWILETDDAARLAYGFKPANLLPPLFEARRVQAAGGSLDGLKVSDERFEFPADFDPDALTAAYGRRPRGIWLALPEGRAEALPGWWRGERFGEPLRDGAKAVREALPECDEAEAHARWQALRWAMDRDAGRATLIFFDAEGPEPAALVGASLPNAKDGPRFLVWRVEVELKPQAAEPKPAPRGPLQE